MVLPTDTPEPSTVSTSKPDGSPWSSTGCFIDRHPWWVCGALFFVFWIYRSQVYDGDGDQLTRMVESGLWMVHTELLSQAAFQLAYKILFPWGWDGLSVINLVSCLAGAAAIRVLFQFNKAYVGIDPLWVLGLFGSSGFLLYANGHTEYYPLFLVTLFFYGYVGVGYLRDRFSMTAVGLAFSLAAWMHLGILFAAPTLLILIVLKKNWQDIGDLLLGLLLLGAAYFVKEFHPLLGFTVQGLSPSSNFIPMEPDLIRNRFYTMFSWGHLADILYAWTMRSWIFWPVVLWAAAAEGFKSILRPDRLFLLFYTLAFTFFTLTWHPDLGILQDWDLFAIEAAPCLLLVLLYLPSFLNSPFRRYALAMAVTASFFILFSEMVEEAQLFRREYGAVRIELSQPLKTNVTLNGHHQTTNVPAIREGVYSTKVINLQHMRVHDFYVDVAPHTTSVVALQVGPTEGRGGAKFKY